MDRVGALAALNRKVLHAYSGLTSQALAAAVPLRLAVPHLQAVLAFNVDKEVEKDALAIRNAAKFAAAGSPPTRESVEALLAAARDVDRAFLGRVGRLPIGIVIPYDDITPVRLRRMERLTLAAHRVLAEWPGEGGVRVALQASYSRAELESLLYDLLRLYAMETQVLSRAVRLPALLVPIRERIAQGLFRVMQDTGARLAHTAAAMVHAR